MAVPHPTQTISSRRAQRTIDRDGKPKPQPIRLARSVVADNAITDASPVPVAASEYTPERVLPQPKHDSSSRSRRIERARDRDRRRSMYGKPRPVSIVHRDNLKDRAHPRKYTRASDERTHLSGLHASTCPHHPLDNHTIPTPTPHRTHPAPTPAPTSNPISYPIPSTPGERLASTEQWVHAQEWLNAQEEAQRLRRANRTTAKWVKTQVQETYYVGLDGMARGVDSGPDPFPDFGPGVRAGEVKGEKVDERWYAPIPIDMSRARTRRLWDDFCERWTRAQSRRAERAREMQRKLECEMREREAEMWERERVARDRLRAEMEDAEERRRVRARKEVEDRTRARETRTRGYPLRPPYPTQPHSYPHPYAPRTDTRSVPPPGHHRQNTTTTTTADAWKRYEAGWAAFTTAPPSSVRFSAMPWPMLSPPREVGDITVDRVAALLLSDVALGRDGAQGQSSSSLPKASTATATASARKERIRSAQLKWHPDRFRRMLGKVVEAERATVEEGAGVVARCLNELMTRESSSSQQQSRDQTGRTNQSHVYKMRRRSQTH